MTENDTEGSRNKSSRMLPSEFMRGRRPYLFSDRETTSGYHLDKSTLDHCLETLTSRNQHLDFEVFCRKLAEKEIAPNLRPQTGPMGGGDSKADTETYPVAKEIESRWFVGKPNSGKERWAFAFSAKKRWTEKVRNDVKGLINTGRDYDLIYFITSRYARDRDRARLEDELTEQYNVEVRILDRSWILEKVFENEHIDIAYNYLKAGSYDPNKDVVGPNDYRRELQLDSLEAELNDDERYSNLEYQRVEDAIVAAKLSRSLEKPRFETDGRYERAVNLAKAHGIGRQEIRATYEYAWTTYWWFDDFKKFSEIYSAVETLALGSDNARDLELLSTLLGLLDSSIRHGLAASKDVAIDERTSRLEAALKRIVGNKARPNNALHAETILLLLRANLAIRDSNPTKLSDYWKKLSNILDQAERLGEYPIDNLQELIEIFGEISSEDPNYDELCEKLATFVANRRSDGEAGIVLLKRGQQKLDAELRYDAIRFLGKASNLLIKREYRSELLEAQLQISIAYRSAGLLWSARASCLAACVAAFADFEEKDQFVPETFLSVKLFAWISLELGYISDYLNAFHLLQILKSGCPWTDESIEKIEEDLHRLDLALGSYFLNAQASQLSSLGRLPDILDCIGLVGARLALLFRLGHESYLREEGSIPKNETDEQVAELFENLRRQFPENDAPPNFIINGNSILSTVVLGTKFSVETTNTPSSSVIAHSVLAIIEAFLATSIGKDILPHTEEFRIQILSSASFDTARYEIFPDEMTAKIQVPANVDPKNMSPVRQILGSLTDLVIDIIGTFAHVPHPHETIDSLVIFENALGRAVNFSDATSSYSRIFGKHCSSLSEWDEYVNTDFSMNMNDRLESSSTNEQGPEDIQTTPDEANLDLISNDPNQIRHSDQRLLSVIDVPLWARVGWSGVGFQTAGGHAPPLMGLIFQNEEAAAKIFERWRDRFGEHDSEDSIRISVIRGVSQDNPHHYRILITSEPPKDEPPSNIKKTWLQVARSNQMETTNPINLNRFIGEYERFNLFGLAPAIADGGNEPNFLTHLVIAKTKLHICYAWQIRANDPEILALHGDDDPVIPFGVIAPPVHEAFRIKQKLKRD